MIVMGCPRCASAVALHEGRPVRSTTGAIELWHPSCWAVRDARGVEEVTIVAPLAPRRFRVRAAGAAAVVACVVGAAHRARCAGAAASLAAIDVAEHETPADEDDHHSSEGAPPSLDPRWPMPDGRGQPLDEQYPVARRLDPSGDRHRRAHARAADRGTSAPSARASSARECGAGHCGVDLGGPIGRPVVAVADGTVVRVERHELGLDGKQRPLRRASSTTTAR